MPHCLIPLSQDSSSGWLLNKPHFSNDSQAQKACRLHWTSWALLARTRGMVLMGVKLPSTPMQPLYTLSSERRIWASHPKLQRTEIRINANKDLYLTYGHLWDISRWQWELLVIQSCESCETHSQDKNKTASLNTKDPKMDLSNIPSHYFRPIISLRQSHKVLHFNILFQWAVQEGHYSFSI